MRSHSTWSVSALITAIAIFSLVTFASTAFAGPNTYGALSSAAGPLTADGSQQTVATTVTSQSAGGATVTSLTVLLGGSAGAGDITGVYFTNGTNTWSATGSFGSGSSVVCSGNAKPGAGTYSINVTLAGTAAGKTVSVQLTAETPSSGGTGIPSNVSNAVSIAAPPASNSYGTMSSMPGPLTADLTQQTVATVPVTLNSGGLSVSSYTVNLGGTVASGDVAGVYVTDGTNTWSATGSYGNGSSVVCSGSNTIPGATLSIKVTLNASADTKTVAVTLLTDSNTASSLPKGPSSALTISAPAGPASTIANCSGCHAYPPEDGSARNTPVGAVIGDHATHNYVCSTCHVTPATTTPADHAHRNKNIEMATPVYSGTGAYSRGASFAQSNNPTTGTCSNISCHNNSATPQWGVGATTCATCHSLPPATGAHSAHFTAKGWATGATTNCTQCHPDNNAAHSSVTDGTPVVTRTNTSYASGSCSGTGIGLGCHNEYATPVWASGTATCTNCHVAGGAKATDPASGLHAVTPTVTGQKHDQTVAGGCAVCHTTMGATHYNGTFTGDANLGLAAFYTQSAADTGSCLTTGCHSGRDDWSHKWTSAAGAYTTNITACANCHGANAGAANLGTTGVVHRAVTSKHTTGTNYTCKDCHAIEGAGYTYAWSSNDWGGTSNHGDGKIDVNGTGTNYKEHGAAAPATDDGLCFNCHTSQDGTHNFVDTGWTLSLVAGDSITTACGECHANGVKPGSASGAHTIHNAGTAALVAGGAACTPCHGDNSGQGYQNTLAGTHGNLSVNFAGATYSTAVRNDLTGTCLTASCHNVSTGTDQSAAWNATQLACDDCHYYAATTTPTSAGNTGHGRPLSADHGNHFGTGGSFACADCHGTDPVAGDTTHINGVTTLADKAVAAQDEANVTVTTWNDGTNSCANAACHNPSGTTYSAIWQTSTAGCTLCHSASDPATGSHNKHMTAATTFGINTIACTSCHPNNGTNNRHRNGSVTFAAGMNYTAGAVDVLGTLGTCTTTTCHNNGVATPAAVVTPTWGTASADCTICHGNAPATGKHAKHVANTAYVDGGCIDCHTAANTTSHINGSRNMASQITDMDLVTGGNQLTAPGGWNGTCANACHIANTASDWTAGTLACADCHGSGKVTTPAMDRGWPPATGAHAKHLANTAYVTGSNCVNCHNNNTTTHSTLNNVVTLATGTSISANPGNGSCTNTCHAAAQASDWTGGSAAIGCVDCHSGTYIGGGAKGPASGLHNIVPTVSGVQHDDSFGTGGTCASCHTSVMAQTTTHIKGTFTGNGSVAGDRTAMGLAAFYSNSGSDNTGTCATTACHLGGSTGSDAWAHKWDSTAGYYTTNTTACKGCHGDSAGFNPGVDHRSRGPHTSGATYGCADCHVLEAATSNYTFAWNSNDWGGTSKHGNSTIEVNTNGNYNTTTNLCTACHNSTDNIHNFVDTGWTIANLLGDAVAGGSCNSCHGYPPVPGDLKNGYAGYNATGEAKGAHAKHVTHIAARAGVTLVAATDQFTDPNVAAVCGVCHNTSSDTNHSTGGGTRQMAIPISYQFGASAPAYNGVPGTSSSVNAKSCSSVNCHFKATPVWQAVGGE